MNRYFKTCLWSPLWFPLLLVVFAYTAESVWPYAYDRIPQWMATAGFIIVMSLAFGGMQYLVTIFLIWPKINFCDAASWMKWVVRLPLIYTPIQLLGVLLVFAWEFDGVIDLFELLPIAVFDLILGYAYVGVWLLGYAVARFLERRHRPSRVIRVSGC